VNTIENPTPPRDPSGRAVVARPGGLRDRRVLLSVIAALIVFAAVAASVWFLRTDDSNSAGAPKGVMAPGRGAPSTMPGVRAEIVSAAKLRQIAAANGRPLYWAGPRSGTRLEYTQTPDGSTYVRYLTGSAKAGNNSADYVVIATYAQPNAFERVSAIARRGQLPRVSLPNGGLAVTRPGRPQNINIVYPNQPHQIEVYAPDPAVTRQLVFGGAIKPVR
jgi:hypothetical protein